MCYFQNKDKEAMIIDWMLLSSFSFYNFYNVVEHLWTMFQLFLVEEPLLGLKPSP